MDMGFEPNWSAETPEPGVASARTDECDSGIVDGCIQTNSDATVRPVTLPEGGPLF